MKLSRRDFMAASAATAVTGMASGFLPASVAKAANNTARVGYNSDYFGASMPAVANAQHLWKKHGLDADLKVFTNGPLQVQALEAGSLDFGYIGPGAFWLPAAGRAKIIAINVIGFSDRVVGQPGIKSIADLKGKRVGVPEGTSGDMILRIALKKANMTINDIQLVYMKPSTVVAAFSSQKIAGAGLWYPLIGVMKQHVPNLNVLASDKDFYPKTVFPSAFIARNELVENSPEFVKRMIAVIKDAQNYRAAHFQQSVQETSKLLNIPASKLETGAKLGKLLTSDQLVKDTKNGTVDKWLSTLNAMFEKFGEFNKHKSLKPEQYYTGKLYISA